MSGKTRGDAPHGKAGAAIERRRDGVGGLLRRRSIGSHSVDSGTLSLPTSTRAPGWLAGMPASGSGVLPDEASAAVRVQMLGCCRFVLHFLPSRSRSDQLAAVVADVRVRSPD